MARRHEDRKPGQRVQRVGSVRRQSGIVVKPSKVLGEGSPQQRDGKVRLNHFLAMSGVCSRRNADELIASGRVEVNGALVTELGVRIDPQVDDVRFDGARLQPERSVYVLLNKPKGVVCTNATHEQKKRVIDLLPGIRGRIFTVGRLDMDSEGLILLTNDGSFALEMTHPRYGVTKLYAVTVRGRVEEAVLEKARGGVWLSEGPTSGMQLKIERVGKDYTFLKVTLREGKNREIRRVFAKLGHPVRELKRIRLGHLNLHGLSDGEWRFLKADEVARLREEAKGEAGDAPPTPAPRARRPQGSGSGPRGSGPRGSGPQGSGPQGSRAQGSRPQSGSRPPQGGGARGGRTGRPVRSEGNRRPPRSRGAGGSRGSGGGRT